MNDEKMEAAREKARAEWKSRCEAVAKPGQIAPTLDAFWGYNDGFTAGYSAANEWVRIDGPEDLPKEEGFYLWQYRSNGGHNVQYIHDTTPEYYVAEYAAWRKVEPYQSKGEVSGED